MARTTGTYEASEVAGESVRAFVPHPLPPSQPKIRIPGALAAGWFPPWNGLSMPPRQNGKNVLYRGRNPPVTSTEACFGPYHSSKDRSQRPGTALAPPACGGHRYAKSEQADVFDLDGFSLSLPDRWSGIGRPL